MVQTNPAAEQNKNVK